MTDQRSFLLNLMITNQDLKTEAQDSVYQQSSTCHEHNLSIILPWKVKTDRLRKINPQTVARSDSHAHKLFATTWQRILSMK